MASEITFSRLQIVPTMQRIYGLVDEACRAAGDMDVIEYSCLVDVAEHAHGLPYATINAHYPFLQDALRPFELLEHKELIMRKRSESDRRSFAFSITIKGEDRIALIDKAIALLMVESTPRATEERFEQFIAQLHAISQERNNQLTYRYLFPAYALQSLCAFHWLVLEESSVAGLSTTAFAILSLLQESPARPDASTIAYKVGIPDAIIDVFLERMEDRRWLRRRDDGYAITETGRQKCATFSGSIAKHYSAVFLETPSEQWQKTEQVVENCLYLFG